MSLITNAFSPSLEILPKFDENHMNSATVILIVTKIFTISSELNAPNTNSPLFRNLLENRYQIESFYCCTSQQRVNTKYVDINCHFHNTNSYNILAYCVQILYIITRYISQKSHRNSDNDLFIANITKITIFKDSTH